MRMELLYFSAEYGFRYDILGYNRYVIGQIAQYKMYFFEDLVKEENIFWKLLEHYEFKKRMKIIWAIYNTMMWKDLREYERLICKISMMPIPPLTYEEASKIDGKYLRGVVESGSKGTIQHLDKFNEYLSMDPLADGVYKNILRQAIDAHDHNVNSSVKLSALGRSQFSAQKELPSLTLLEDIIYSTEQILISDIKDCELFTQFVINEEILEIVEYTLDNDSLLDIFSEMYDTYSEPVTMDW